MPADNTSYGEGRANDWTPTWQSSGTAPVLNNGLLSGKYSIEGRIVIGTIRLTIGSTTTVGTGTYYFTAPTNMLYPSATVASLFDSSTGFIYNAFGRYDTIARWVFLTSAVPAAIIGQTVPFTWAQDDQFLVNFCYVSAE